jgi:hypothetical protein
MSLSHLSDDVHCAVFSPLSYTQISIKSVQYDYFSKRNRLMDSSLPGPLAFLKHHGALCRRCRRSVFRQRRRQRAAQKEANG